MAQARAKIDRNIPVGWEEELEENGFILLKLNQRHISPPYSTWKKFLVDEVKQRCHTIFQEIDGGKFNVNF